jgi:uncharacterized protein YciI
MTTPQRFLVSDISLTELTGDQLRARVARAHLYLIEMPSAGNIPDSAIRDHLAYMYTLESQGRLYGYGPLGTTDVCLAIVAARSREEAGEIASRDPLAVTGLRTNVVTGHTMNEGVACYFARALSKRAEGQQAPFDPDISGVNLSLQDLQARAIGVPLFLVDLKPTDKPRPSEDTQTGLDHFVWLRDNEMQAKLMSCGPVEATSTLEKGIWGGGLGIFATSQEEADLIASVEPSGSMGYRHVSARPWTLDYGLAAPIAKALVGLNTLP